MAGVEKMQRVIVEPEAEGGGFRIEMETPEFVDVERYAGVEDIRRVERALRTNYVEVGGQPNGRRVWVRKPAEARRPKAPI